MKLEDAKIRVVSTDMQHNKSSTKRISLFQEKFKNEISYLNINQLISYRYQARELFDDDSLIALSNTIKQHGIRQPLTVLARSDEKYEIVSGERRYKAAIMAGLTVLPCLIINDEKQAEEIALIENVQRTDLTMLELGRALSGLLKREIFSTQLEMSEQLGIPRTKIIECINLTKLTPNVQKLIAHYNITGRDIMRNILSFESENDQINYIENHIIPDPNNLISTKKSNNRMKNNSVIRIGLNDYGFSIQKNGMLKMSPDDKTKLKDLLIELIAEL